MKKSTLKLRLDLEQIRILTSGLDQVAGGMIRMTATCDDCIATNTCNNTQGHGSVENVSNPCAPTYWC